ncbi:MAG: arginine--tRNA ligase [Gammaproteobacteria bacterium]|nr:MAG: arginine--tRNA ligase [Gammaproteobacteria bacterium]
MKEKIESLLAQALKQLQSANVLPSDATFRIQVERTRDPAHGDFASNLALAASKQAGMPPRQLAEKIIEALPDDKAIEQVEVAGPGFINFTLHRAQQASIIVEILSKREKFGRAEKPTGKKIHIEFVSANPTGPLHVGHGRGAAYGATIADLLEAAGNEVFREYYVNDAGRQMHILATSVWLRYLALFGEPVVFPANGYRGDYVVDIARQLKATRGDALRKPWDMVIRDVRPDEPQGGDKEAHIDDLIRNARRLLGDTYEDVMQLALEVILNDIRDDLAAFGVHYQNWFSEKSLVSSGAIEEALRRLEEKGLIYEKDGAKWFRSTAFGDDKDRVVVRDNGETTYFASDIAYHMNKLDRGFDLVIDVLGADHHGYVPRVRAAMQALGADPKQLLTPLVQFAVLYRGGQKVQMSTRSGSFVTLRQLREEVGNDAARFFYVMRKSDQHMDFDLDLAVSQSNDNPLYYIQYAHARIASLYRQIEAQGHQIDLESGQAYLDRLTLSEEQALIKTLATYPDIVDKAARDLAPHLLVHYLRQLAQQFHAYYNNTRIGVDDASLRLARLALAGAVKQVIANGLSLLGVSAPDKM